MREQFEKLPEIAKIIKERNAFYCNKGDYYLCPDDQFAESYLDGAWYTYQEQQKKVSEVINMMMDVYTEVPITSIKNIEAMLQ